jgi:regulator of protease activity HflC (stomatin/prohibitin superfamily)
MGIYLLGIFLFLILASIRQINQYERGIRFTLGRYSGILQPGWHVIWPVFQSMRKVDVRVKAVDVPSQLAITKDNVSANINAVIYYKVASVEKAVLEVENFFYAVSQLAQTTMRNIIGEVTLDELLSERNKISERIRDIIDKATDAWGIKVDNVELKDISLPEEMKRVIARQAEAEREKRAVITKAEGDAVAAVNLAKAAHTLAEAPGALHLRTLSTINDLSSDQSNTVIFAVPLEILDAIKGMGNYFKK